MCVCAEGEGVAVWRALSQGWTTEGREQTELDLATVPPLETLCYWTCCWFSVRAITGCSRSLQ